jgi:hypothetical protein
MDRKSRWSPMDEVGLSSTKLKMRKERTYLVRIGA